MAKKSLSSTSTIRAGTQSLAADQPLPASHQWLRLALPVGFLLVLTIPAFTYFVTNRAGDVLFGADIPTEVRFYTLFRLFGLYAFTFLWGQLMVGPFMKPLSRLYGQNWLPFHRLQGLLALLLAVLHPLILYVAFVVWTGSFNWFEAVLSYTPQVTWVWLGETALLLMALTITTALLMRRPWLRRKWHWIHLLNYVVFGLVWVHSFLLGSEAHTFPMSWLYPFFGITVIVAMAYRRLYQAPRNADDLA
jgi:DMSO/TMAO reductase YedYZ heme-binding membrane subunit